jgi:RNA polymerase sigma-70 factor (ECF subfamily)
MPPSDSFSDLMARLRAGDEGAAEEVFRRYSHRLVALARGRIGGLLRQKVDPEDVLQSVFKSFFARQAEGQFELHHWDGLWGLLARITMNKCGHRMEHFRAARRDAARESAPADGTDSNPGWEAIARDPSPEEVVCFTETVEELMRDLDQRERLMLTYRLQGHTPPEIGQLTGRTERSVYRLLNRVRQKLDALRQAV